MRIDGVIGWLVMGWLAISSVVILTLVRQVSLLSLRVGLIAPPKRRADAASAKLFIGKPVPDVLLHEVPVLMQDDDTYVLWVSAGCTTCTALLDDLDRHLERAPMDERFVVLISGPATAAAALTAKVRDDWTIVEDPIASEATAELGLTATPYFVLVRSGQLRGWSYAQTAVDLRQFRRAIRNADRRREAAANGTAIVDVDAIESEQPSSIAG